MFDLKDYKNLIMKKSRQHKADQFYNECKNECKVLDVGVSIESNNAGPARNSFLKDFKFSKKFYTGLGVQDLSLMSIIHPGYKFYTYDGTEFPFGNDEFGMVWSNAVIEHVGRHEQQLYFLNEMLRVSKKIFFSTPNKYFPIETHTNILFLHYFNTRFYSYLKHSNYDYDPKTLNLLSHKKLSLLLDESNASTFRIIRNKLYGFTMTYSVVASR